MPKPTLLKDFLETLKKEQNCEASPTKKQNNNNDKPQLTPAVKETKNARKRRERKEAEKQKENLARLQTPAPKSESTDLPAIKVSTPKEEQFGDKTISVAALFEIMENCLQ